MTVEVHELVDGAQPPEAVAGWLAQFLAGAQHTLEIAIYDIKLPPELTAVLARAFTVVNARGVRSRLVYNVDHPARLRYPPPSQTDTSTLDALGVSEVRAIPGVPDLMHHKYVIRDAGIAEAAVWTGSCNWTADSWRREENIIVALGSQDLAASYLRNFEELWQGGSVQASGHFTPGWAEADADGRRFQCRPVFSPGRGSHMAHLVADRLGQAERRIRVASPVLTSGPILASLAELRPGMDCRVVYDRTQMDEVLRQWSADPHSAWKAPVFRTAIGRLDHASKVTTPYAPGTVHDYMHAKLVVADDTVLTGSYNLSHSGEMNAENVLEIRDATLADAMAAFIDRLFAKYAAA